MIYLMQEVEWELLNTRRKKHKLILLYKMSKGLVPTYLSDILPQSVGNRSHYNLRNSSDIQSIRSRTALYAHSFLPSVINDWNSLYEETRNAESVQAFKRTLNKDVKGANALFYQGGDRRLQVLHTRLRTQCSP